MTTDTPCVDEGHKVWLKFIHRYFKDHIQKNQTEWKQLRKKKKINGGCIIAFSSPNSRFKAHLRHQIPLSCHKRKKSPEPYWTTRTWPLATWPKLSRITICVLCAEWPTLINNILAWKSAQGPKTQRLIKWGRFAFQKVIRFTGIFYKSVILVKTFSPPHLYESHPPNPLPLPKIMELHC